MICGWYYCLNHWFSWFPGFHWWERFSFQMNCQLSVLLASRAYLLKSSIVNSCIFDLLPMYAVWTVDEVDFFDFADWESFWIPVLLLYGRCGWCELGLLTCCVFFRVFARALPFLGFADYLRWGLRRFKIWELAACTGFAGETGYCTAQIRNCNFYTWMFLAWAWRVQVFCCA